MDLAEANPLAVARLLPAADAVCFPDAVEDVAAAEACFQNYSVADAAAVAKSSLPEPATAVLAQPLPTTVVARPAVKLILSHADAVVDCFRDASCRADFVHVLVVADAMQHLPVLQKWLPRLVVRLPRLVVKPPHRAVVAMTHPLAAADQSSKLAVEKAN